MSLNNELADLVAALVRVADLHGKQATLEKKLLDVVIDPLLARCDLIAARGMREKHGELLLFAIQRSSLAKLKALSKSWNPHRPGPMSEATPDQLTRELSSLLKGTLQPVPKQSKTTRKSARTKRSYAGIAAE